MVQNSKFNILLKRRDCCRLGAVTITNILQIVTIHLFVFLIICYTSLKYIHT